MTEKALTAGNTRKTPRRGNILLTGLLGLVLLCAAGCGTTGSHEKPPHWVDHPKTDDSVYTYVIGHASDQPSAEKARDAALVDAVRRVALMFVPDGNEDAVNALLEMRIIRDVEIVPDCVYHVRRSGKYECWIQASYPLREKEKVQAGIDSGKTLRTRWAEALSEMNMNNYSSVQNIITNMLNETDRALLVNVNMDEARMLLADSYREQNDELQARIWYSAVLNTSNSDELKKLAEEQLDALPEPPRFWPMHDRWNNARVALLCLIREGEKPRRFADLTNILTGDCTEARIRSVDISQECSADEMTSFFDSMEFSGVCSKAVENDAPVVLGVIFDIDPAKKGTFVENFGVKIPVPDTAVRYFVVNAAECRNVFNGQFKEVAGNRPEQVLAERTAMLLIAKHLVPDCPAVVLPVEEEPGEGEEGTTDKHGSAEPQCFGIRISDEKAGGG